MMRIPMWQRIGRSRLVRNIVTNYLAVAWLGGLSLLLIPVYLRLLGPQQWGLVAVCMTLQALWGLLDAGLGQIMPRDVARAQGEPAALGRTYGLYASAYGWLGLAGFALGQLAAGWLAVHWVQAEGLAAAQIESVLRLMGVQFLFQFANQAAIGYWSGTEQQTRMNLLQCVFATLKHGSALVGVMYWRADAVGYLMGFVLWSALEWACNRHAVREQLGLHGVQAVRAADVLQLARQVGVLTAGVLVGMLVSQMDRLVLSRMVDVAVFGRYVIMAQLGLAMLQLQYPLMRAYFPRVVRADAHGGTRTLRQLAWGLLLLCALPCAALAWAAPWLLQLWLDDPQIVAEGVAPLRLILLAVVLNAAYHVIYQRMLARGASMQVVRINLVALLSVVILTPVLAGTYGVVAGGWAWLIAAGVQLVMGMRWWRQQLPAVRTVL
jgi:O-antigen/teichoic acid export membrane protein